MNKKRLNWLILVCMLVLSIPIAAQHNKKPLTNEDVIKMVKAGLPESTIVLAIQKNSNRFDTSPDALIALKEAGATQKVMDAVLESKHELTSPNKKEQTGVDLGAVRMEPKAKPESPDSSSELKQGIYRARSLEIIDGGWAEQTVVIKIKIESIDKDRNIKAELLRFDSKGWLKGKIDTDGKLQLEGIICCMSEYKYKFTLTATVKDKALTKGKYQIVSQYVETKGAFNIAVLEED